MTHKYYLALSVSKTFSKLSTPKLYTFFSAQLDSFYQNTNYCIKLFLNL